MLRSYVKSLNCTLHYGIRNMSLSFKKCAFLLRRHKSFVYGDNGCKSYCDHQKILDIFVVIENKKLLSYPD